MAEPLSITLTLYGTRDGNPPEALLGTVASRPDGKRRACSVMVIVPNPELFARLQSEVKPDERVRVTLAPNDAGSTHTYTLTDFERVEEKVKAAA